MVSGRPLLYLSLPGVAFILGVFWFRRRNKNRLDNDTKKIGNEVHEDLITKTTTACNNNSSSSKPTSTPTKSMNINGTIPTDDENPANRMFGKSAPIKIVQNGRGPSPVKQTAQQQLDSEVLKTKIQDAEHKLLRSIEEDFENLSSPVDLPDSINNRTSFYSRNVDIKKDKPVVIMATTTPKISPENSFLESKYTKECAAEDENNKDNKETESQTNATTTPTDTECTVDDNCGTTNVTDKRNVDAASPSLSLCSVQSGDSGKGSSLPRSEATRAKTTYEFFLPDSLVGYLYGRRHAFINQIKSKTNATVVLRKKMYPGKLRVCAVEGTDSEIQAALAMIRQRLPAKRYPKLTMQRIHFALPQSVVPLSNESLLNLQLNLIEGINNDVVVSAIISGAHIFVQQPLHPTHPSLVVLQKCLYDSYTTGEAPLLPGIELNAVCVMSVNGIWYRVQIVNGDIDDPERCVVKFLDFGGYMNVHLSELRQIRSDFMTVPFQATECILSNIEPIDSSWTPESADILCRLTKGIVLQAQIAGYNSHNIPEIFLFACLGPNNVIFINKELVARNLAKWVDDIRD
ncbi:A-kinase anchor protein 1, mitochondrial [Musca vetustissima]|uniref:A-kinase anchor protein 1, mitochondrial n=1 Tax=Musca vetustissima TaxID=27455 RepID=UPI002AB78F37|nr:A-kinase anchor protein 1, mitochondrial [Musca vetustissima]